MAWNPRKTAEEIKKDPWRAARAAATGGASEIPNVINANPSLKDTGILGDIMGGKVEKKLATPQLNVEDVLKPQNIENPYAEAAKQAMQQNVLPDFAQAQATAGQQGAFAKALQDLYGAGAGQMTGLMSNLQRQMSGDFGPGGALAQKVLEQGLSQNVAGVRSQLASQRGLNPALAARYAAQQTAQLGGQTAQQAGILGLQQQLAAQQQLGQLAGTSATLGAKAGDIFGQMRGQDITQAQATSDAALKRLGTLVQSDVGMRQIQAQTGMAENEIRQKVAAANQAAALGDRQLAAQIIGSMIGAAGQVGAKMATAYSGGRIDGQAQLTGDHPANDTVPAMLSPGEIVIPRSAAGSKKDAKSFIEALDDWDESEGYSKVLKARQKKNYFDGGVVDHDKELLAKSNKEYFQQMNQEIPAIKSFKERLDEGLGKYVVDPMARAGYPTLGAAMATVPSTLAEALVPSTAADVAMSMFPFPKLGKLKRGISEEIAKKESLILPESLEIMSTRSSKIPSVEEKHDDLLKYVNENVKKEFGKKLTKEQEEAIKTLKSVRSESEKNWDVYKNFLRQNDPKKNYTNDLSFYLSQGKNKNVRNAESEFFDPLQADLADLYTERHFDLNKMNKFSVEKWDKAFHKTKPNPYKGEKGHHYLDDIETTEESSKFEDFVTNLMNEFDTFNAMGLEKSLYKTSEKPLKTKDLYKKQK